MKLLFSKLQMNRSTLRSIYLLCLLFSIVGIVAITHSGFVPFKYILLLILAALLPNSLLIFLLEKPARGMFTQIIAGLLVAIIVLYSILMLSVGIDSQKLITKVTSDTTAKKSTIDTTKPFNLYISGIDTYGNIDTVSRSDVNIIASINPQTKHILLTTIPRDSYVRIAGGGNNQYDKLTHAGNYGVDSSMQTVAQLMNVDISTYARINFTSFIKIVDEIGGIDVSNPVSFKTDSGQVFSQGVLHLNGKDALTFSRERHNLEGGDNDRGVNQERVIAAILAKASSPSILSHYQGVLSVLGDSVQTNISQKSLTGLINQQVDQHGEWTTTMTNLSGKGQTGGLPSYAMPASQLYMFILDQNSVKQAQARIQAALSTGSVK